MLGSAVRRVLGVCGLALARDVRALGDRLQHVEQRRQHLDASVHDLRRQLKTATEQARQQQKTAAAEIARQTAAAAAAEQRIVKLQARFDEQQQRLAARPPKEERPEHKQRLADARQRAAVALDLVHVAQEHLMVTEMKLDLIEAAINALDRRTRQKAAVPGPEHVAR